MYSSPAARGTIGELLVKEGDYVLKGQPLTTGKGRTLPVHASTSGTVTNIGLYPSTHPSALPERSILLSPDGLDKWGDRSSLVNYRDCSPEQLIAHIHQAGVAGLGGAVFPTANKIGGGLNKTRTLIINGAECEPYITADDRLMQEYADELIQGCEILRHILQPEVILIAVEDNKPEAISALKNALQRHQNSDTVVRTVPTKYPSGGARQLTKILTGKEVPHHGRSSDIGVLMQNVGTVYAIKRAVINGEPLLERIITLSGDAMSQCGNVWALLGTPISFLLQQGGYTLQTPPRVIMGGPLMGFTLPDLSVPVTKMSNCLIAPTQEEMALPEPEQACIRCSQCADACPAGLLPQQLYWFSRGKEHEKARTYNLFDCIECGACAYVCPSHIPLVQYYRQEKAEIRDLDEQAELAKQAKIRFEARQARLEREKQARLLRHKQAETKPSKRDSELIQSALARVKKRQEAAQVPTSLVITSIRQDDLSDNTRNSTQHSVLHNKSIIAAKSLKKASYSTAETSTPAKSEKVDTQTDDRQAALAAAIARAKAKKAQLASATATESTAEPQTSIPEKPQNDRQAAVAAAIARARAKKAALSEASSSLEPTQENTAPQEPEIDERKAAVAEAIARVKARKAQQAAALTTASEK